MYHNTSKTASANLKGIVISFQENNKHKFIPYENQYVKQVQLHGTAKYQQFEPPVFNLAQHKVYSEAVYGLSVFTKQELEKMPATKKSAIMAHFNKVQRFLNAWKQEIANRRVDNFLIKLFPKSNVIKHMITIKGSDDSIKDKHSFKELGISKEMIAKKLVEVNLLPKEFFKLS